MKIVKTFKFKSIRSALVIPLIFFFLISTILITTLVLHDSQKAANNVLLELRQTMIVLVKDDLNNKLNQAIQLNRINMDMFQKGLLQPNSANERERYFTMALKNFPEVVMTYIGLPDGQFYGARRNIDGTIHIVRNNESTQGNSVYYGINDFGEGTEVVQVVENFDPRTRPWYINALETKEINFSPLYSHFVFKEPTVTSSLPIYDGDSDTLMGVFGVDFLMTWLGDTLGELPIGEHGQVFIVDENHKLVATTSGEDIFKLVDQQSINIPVDESINPITQKVLSLSNDELSKSLPTVSIDGQKYMFGVDTYEQHGLHWRIYTVINTNDFLQEMNKTFLKAIVTVIALSLLFIIVAFILTKQIVKTIIYLNKSAKKLSQGVYEEVLIDDRQDELGELTRSFNNMGMQLTELVNNLERKVSTRTFELEAKNILLNKLSYIDGLAQIPNRRKFNEFFQQVVELSSRNKRPVGLMMLDIDSFKKFNDTYGHVAGDHCIQAIARVLENCIHRSSDLIARYGGEEFVVVLQEATLESVKKMAECIRTEIQSLNIKHRESNWGVVTVSIGVVYGTISIHQSIDEVVKQADDALYLAKSKGKNCIEYSEIQ